MYNHQHILWGSEQAKEHRKQWQGMRILFYKYNFDMCFQKSSHFKVSCFWKLYSKRVLLHKWKTPLNNRYIVHFCKHHTGIIGIIGGLTTVAIHVGFATQAASVYSHSMPAAERQALHLGQSPSINLLLQKLLQTPLSISVWYYAQHWLNEVTRLNVARVKKVRTMKVYSLYSYEVLKEALHYYHSKCSLHDYHRFENLDLNTISRDVLTKRPWRLWPLCFWQWPSSPFQGHTSLHVPPDKKWPKILQT